MSSLPDVGRARPGSERRREAPAQLHVAPAIVTPAPGTGERLRAWAALLRYPLTVYFASRVLYLAIALINVPLQHWPLWEQFANWDGAWYLKLTVWGYPHTIPNYHVVPVSSAESTLGFFPLYPIGMYAIGKALGCVYIVSGMIISIVGGAAATVLVGRMAAEWWDEAAGRRAVLFFCLFPGSIVFSMVYTEGLMLALVAGSLLALQRRRWLLAGALAGLATAIGPVAVAIIPACAAAAYLEIRRRGWRDREALRSLLAPLLAPIGIAAFGVYLWIHTGDPLASFRAQRYAWHEKSSPLALYDDLHKLLDEVFAAHSLHHPGINLNYPAGLLGAVFLGCGLWLLWKQRHRLPLPALVWTAGVAMLTVTSPMTPPNARMLICAFPAVIAVAAALQGRAFKWLIGSSAVLLVAMSFVSYVGTGLRP